MTSVTENSVYSHHNSLTMKKLYAFLFVLVPTASMAQVVVNEFSASNLSQFTDNYSKHEDWIELYNTSGATVSLAGWYMSDTENNPTKWPFPANASIPANGYLRVWCDGRDEFSGGMFHTSFKLNQTRGNDEIVLTDPTATIVENIVMGITHEGHSKCRSVNGAGTWMVTTNPTPNASNTAAPMYTGYAQKPEVNFTGGFYPGTLVVAMTNTPANATVRYTTDGNLPTAASPVFNGTTISSTTVLKLRAFSSDPNVLPSLVEFNTYLINESITLPVFSVAADQLTTLANGNGNIIPKGSIEYFNENGVRTAISYGELNRHGQDSWVNFQRSLDWISRDEMGYTESIRDTLFHYSDRDEYQRFIFRASGDDNYPANNVPPNPNNSHDGGCHIRDEYVQTLAHNGGMKLDRRAQERVVVFLNGQYWGVYAIREKPEDHDYTDYYYDQGKYDLQWLQTWGGTWAEYGGNQAFTDWEVTRDFAMNSDMSVQANYDALLEDYNATSLIDYMTINLMVVASDWLNYNTGWWRGLDTTGDHKKWGYSLWDLDATFDYYINYSGVPNTDPDALPCDIEDIALYIDDWFNGNDVGQHEQIFLKLLNESPDFQQLYYSRYADHVNTIFSCENMLATFDSMVAIIAPEMPRHITRWGGSMNEWNGNIQEMRDFIEARCAVAASNLVDCYSPAVSGPYNLVLRCEPPGLGQIRLNTLTHATLPWQGVYYGSMDNLIEAIPNDPLFVFDHWERSSGGAISPHQDSINASIVLTAPDTLTAVFTNTTDVAQHVVDNVHLSAWPNPATDRIQIDALLPYEGAATVRLFSAQGALVYSRQVSGPAVRLTLPTDGLAPGMYVLSLDTKGGSVQRKMSIVR
jgi:hypothetical protein